MKDSRNEFITKKILTGDLKNISIRGGAATLTGQSAKILLNFISIMILARLLTPQDYGLIAMVTTVTGFIFIFKDMGLSLATIQSHEINHEQISTLFWINVGIGISLTLITLGLAPVIVWFYKDPRLYAVTASLSFAFIFGGLTIQHQAILSRHMQFISLILIDVISLSVGILTGVICAFVGLGYWALVWMPLATSFSNMIGVWWASGWRPGWAFPGSGVRSLLKFGGYITGFSFVNYFSRNFDNVLIGRYCGSESLGFYSKAYSLFLFPIGQITAPISNVAIPALSRLQDDPERFKKYYLMSIKLIAYVTMPLVITMGILSNELIEVILGKQWMQASNIFKIFAVPALIQPISTTVGWLYISLGSTRRFFIWGCIVAPITIISFFIGLPWGPLGVAISYSVMYCFLTYPVFTFALKNTPIKLMDVISTIYRPFILSLISGLIMLTTHAYFVNLGLFWTIFLTLLIGGLTFLSLAWLVKVIWTDMKEIVTTVKLVFEKK